MLSESVNDVMSYIESHIENNITVEELARVARYSEYHFIRLFKQEKINQGFRRYFGWGQGD